MAEAGGETDEQLEAGARAQAEAIAQARQEALASAQRGGLPAFFEKVGRNVRRSQDSARSAVTSVQKPGRELLLWQMRQSSDLAAAWDIAFVLMEEARFVATVPAGRPAPLLEFRAQRRWDVAAGEWQKMGGGDAETWLKCERQLYLERDGAKVVMKMQCHDINVRFDPGAKKLTPVKVDSVDPVTHGSLARAQEKFPNLGIGELAHALRAPGRALGGDRRGAPDAYIRQGRLQGALDPLTQSRAQSRKPEAKEDAGKGFLTWLSGLMRSQGGK